MEKKINEVTRVNQLSNTETFLGLTTDCNIIQIEKQKAYVSATKDQQGLLTPSDYNCLPIIGDLANKQLIHLSSGIIWQRQIVSIDISSADLKFNAHVVLSATILDKNTVNFGKNVLGTFPVTAKLLYKVDGDTLNLYLYGSIAVGSTMGYIITSRRMRPTVIHNIEDISEYTQIIL